MEKIYLSYILPCYNTGPFVCQCIESLYKQGMDENTFEVIFVNNATEDNSEEIVLNIKKQHSNLVYIKLEKNVCAGGAYNAGLKVAKGKYVQFVDSDDYLKDNCMQNIIAQMEQEGIDVLYFNIESFKGLSELTHEDSLAYNGNFPEEFYASNGNEYIRHALNFMAYSVLPVPAYRKMIKRSVLLDNKIYFTPTTIGCDYLHNLQLLSCLKRIKIITDKLYMFRYNPNGVTKSRFSSNAIIYALNNYCRAYHVIKNTPFDDEIKNSISSDALSLLDSYIGAMKYIDNKERTLVINGLDDIQFVRNVPNGIINKMLIMDGFVSHHILNTTLFNRLSIIRKHLLHGTI